MSDFTRTIPGDGCLDLSLTVESGQPRSAASQEETTMSEHKGYAPPRTQLPRLPHGTGEAHMEQVVEQAMERQGGSVMTLEERIARLIDPEAWWLLDQRREEHHDPDERPPSRFTIESRDAARRVIDGLHLKELEFLTFRGPVKGIIKGHIDQEDM